MKQNRRNFLKWTGVLTGGALLPACQAKVEKLIPFLNQPENYVPGKKQKYRTFFYDHSDFAEVVVSNIDNRPIKLEGNPNSEINMGGLNARIQASLFNFYHPNRLKEPSFNKQTISWEDLDRKVVSLLKKNQKENNRVLIVLPYLISPTEKKAIKEFKNHWKNCEEIIFAPQNYSALAFANQKLTGNNFIPSFAFDKARCIVGFQCDFLGNWLNGIKNTTQYSKAKKQHGSEFIHIQFESLFSVTGSNATQRTPLNINETNDLIAGLHARCFRNNYQILVEENKERVDELLILLENYPQQSLLLYGGDDALIHQLVLELNSYFKNIDNTVLSNHPDLLYCSNSEVNQFQSILENSAETIIFYKTNPFYFLDREGELAKKILEIPNRIGIFDTENETSKECTILASSHHHYESWSDAQIDKDTFCLGQPVFNSIFNTRTAGENLLRWSENPKEWRDYLKANWFENIIPLAENNTQLVWNEVKTKGKLKIKQESSISKKVVLSEASYPEIEAQNEFVLQFFYDSKMGIAENLDNNFLHELADPITKVSWDNYFTLNPDDLNRIANGKSEKKHPLLEVHFNNTVLKAPAISVRDQAKNTIGFALGYGTSNNSCGMNAYPAIFSDNKWKKHWRVEQVKLIDGNSELAVIHQTTKLPSDYLTEINEAEILNKADKFSKFEKWLMLIDMDLCTGCSSCVVACRAENNIPLVGKSEILKKRDIDWLKIERYELENGQILHLPLMCQHCDNAPCESVCPVLATTHSSDGLNQMVYNRCVGTRYCAANCVYNVRKFNWSDYRKPPFDKLNSSESKFSNLMLNPDVTLRTKGIMEKCNFCQHRIQEERENAKLEGRKMNVENAQPACASSCPAKAIRLINLNSKEGAGFVINESKPKYQLFKHYNANPSVIYMSNRLKA